MMPAIGNATLRTGVAIAVIAPLAAGAVETPKDTPSCYRWGEGLYGKAEALAEKTGIKVPREFARVSSNLDDFCKAGRYDKARISLDWMDNCIRNWRKPYRLGFCARGKAYFCAIDPGSDACKHATRTTN